MKLEIMPESKISGFFIQSGDYLIYNRSCS